MQDPTGRFNVEIPNGVIDAFRMGTYDDFKTFCEALRQREYAKTVGTNTEEDRLAIKHKIVFLNELDNFFKNLLTRKL